MTKLDCRGDARLIRGGRILRAWGLDELPQLFNVIRGEMSLVGPRPCTPHEFDRYLPEQKLRVNAPPGLTGYWQVNGKNKTCFSQMIEHGHFMRQHMSLQMDLSIIILERLPAIAVQVIESRSVKSSRSKITALIKKDFRAVAVQDIARKRELDKRYRKTNMKNQSRLESLDAVIGARTIFGTFERCPIATSRRCAMLTKPA